MNDFWYKLVESSSHLRLRKLSFPFLVGAYRLKTGNDQFGVKELLEEIRNTSLPKEQGKGVYVSLCEQSKAFKIEVRTSYGTSKVSPFISNESSEPVYYDFSGKILGDDWNGALLKLVEQCYPLIERRGYSFDPDSNEWRDFNGVELTFINAVFHS